MIRFSHMEPIEKGLVEDGLSFASGYDQTRKTWVAFVGFDEQKKMYEGTGISKTEAFIVAVNKFWQENLTYFPPPRKVKNNVGSF